MSPIRAGTASEVAPVSGTTIGAAVFARLLRLLADWQQRQRDRHTRRALEALDDRTLHDIGVDRSEITSIVATHARGRATPRFDLP